jgi:acyl carrier protein
MSKFYEGMAEIFEIDLSEAIVSTIALVDDCFNIMLDGKSLGSCVTLADVEKLIEAGKKG